MNEWKMGAINMTIANIVMEVCGVINLEIGAIWPLFIYGVVAGCLWLGRIGEKTGRVR